MHLPEFLVIGAAKSGSTTLYHDLSQHADVFLAEKEQSGLLRDLHVDEYAQRFRRARPTELRGDVSTFYTMLPELTGAVERARQFLPHPPKIIYLVRNPIERVISFHYHLHRWTGAERLPADVNHAVRAFPLLVDTSRYAMQLRPWVEYAGMERICVVRFEDYVAQRQDTANRICDFLGLKAFDALDDSVVLNRGDGRPVLSGTLLKISQWRLYRMFIRPLFSLPMRERLRSLVLPPSPPRPAPPAPQTIDFLAQQLAGDADELQRMLGLPQPLWDLAETRRRLGARDLRSADHVVNKSAA